MRCICEEGKSNPKMLQAKHFQEKKVLVPLYKVPIQTHPGNSKVLVSHIQEKITKMGRSTEKGNKEHHRNREPVLEEGSSRKAQLVCMSKIKVEKWCDSCLGIIVRGALRKEWSCQS